MAAINIEGVGRVPVDDSFLSLSPEQQDAVVEEIKQAHKSQPSVGEDVLRSTGTGIAKGTLGILGAPGDIASLAMGAGEWLGNKVSPDLVERIKPYSEKIRRRIAGPTSQELQGKVEQYTGEFYKPQTRYGRFGETIGEFLPGAAVPFGGAARSVGREIAGNLVKYGVLPGAASELAGEQTRGTALEPYARGAAAVATGGLASLVGRPNPAVSRTRAAIPEGVTAQQLDEAENLFQLAQREGQPITRAEALQHVTGGGTRLGDLQRVVEGQGEMHPFFTPRAAQNEAAFGRAAEAIDPNMTRQPQTIGPQIGAAAEGTLNDVRGLINDATGPAYTAAARVTLSPQEFARVRALPGYREARDAVLGDEQLRRYVVGLPENSVGFLQEVKKYLDQAREAATSPMNVQANRQRAAGYSADVGAVDRTLRDASHSYTVAQDVQAEARRRFLEPLMQGPLGQLAQRDITTRQAVEALFPQNPLAVSADQIDTAVRALAQRNPAAARALVRQHAEMTFNEATQNLISGGNQFGGAKFAAGIRGNPQQAANLETAVRALPGGDQIWTGLDRFLNIVEAQGTRQRIGSQTAFNQEVLQDLRRGAPLHEAGTALATGGITAPSRIREVLERWRAGRGAEEIARLLTDPEAAVRFRQIATLPQGSESAARVAARLILLANTATGGRDTGIGNDRGRNNEPLRITVRPGDASP